MTTSTPGSPGTGAADRHDARDAQDSLRCLVARWRTGRRVGRNVYAMVADGDVLIGQFDTAQLAAEAVHRHNDAHRYR